MRLAIEIADRGRGFVLPNPTVGCVIVDNQKRLLSVGAHLKFGENHAEVNAIQTLEPCSHHGKTPPCVDAIIESGISRVIYGMEDPNPKVAGRGVGTLMENDVEVGHFQSLQKECEHLIQDYLHLQKSPLPYVALKVAASLDGQIATYDGESKWITGPNTRSRGRELRGYSCATLIGAGTFLNDDPLLDFRETSFEHKKKNKIVILDPRGKGAAFFRKSRLAKTHERDRIFVLTREQNFIHWQHNGVQLLPFSSKKEVWAKNLVSLRQKGIQSLFVEGGSFAIGQFLKHRLFNRMYYFIAPKILGEGLSWSKGFQAMNLNSALNLGPMSTEKIGDDILITSEFLG